MKNLIIIVCLHCGESANGDETEYTWHVSHRHLKGCCLKINTLQNRVKNKDLRISTFLWCPRCAKTIKDLRTLETYKVCVTPNEPSSPLDLTVQSLHELSLSSLLLLFFNHYLSLLLLFFIVSFRSFGSYRPFVTVSRIRIWVYPPFFGVRSVRRLSKIFAPLERTTIFALILMTPNHHRVLRVILNLRTSTFASALMLFHLKVLRPWKMSFTLQLHIMCRTMYTQIFLFLYTPTQILNTTISFAQYATMY